MRILHHVGSAFATASVWQKFEEASKGGQEFHLRLVVYGLEEDARNLQLTRDYTPPPCWLDVPMVKFVSKKLLTDVKSDIVIGVAIRKTRFLQHWTNLPSWLRGFDSHHPLFCVSGYG